MDKTYVTLWHKLPFTTNTEWVSVYDVWPYDCMLSSCIM